MKEKMGEEKMSKKSERERMDKGFLAVLGGSYALGVGLGAVARSNIFDGSRYIPLIPAALDFIGGGNPFEPNRVVCYMAYGAGVATAFADKIVRVAGSYLEDF